MLPPPADDSPLQWVVATRQSLLVPDLGQSEFRPDPNTLRGLAAVPVLQEDRLLGVLLVGTTQPHALTAKDLTALGAVGERVVLALDTVQQYTGLQGRYDDLAEAYRELLVHSEFSTLAAHDDPLEHVLQAMTIRLTEISGAEGCALMIWDGNAQRSDRLAVHGFALGDAPQDPIMDSLATLTEQVMASHEPLIRQKYGRRYGVAHARLL